MQLKRSYLIGMVVLASLAGCNLPDLFTSSGDGQSAQATEDPGGGEAEPTRTPGIQLPTVQVPSPTPGPTLSIVYTDDGKVWLKEGEAAPTQLSSDENVEQVFISSDGLKVVYTRRNMQEDPVELLSSNTDGSGKQQLLSSRKVKTLYPFNDSTFGFDIHQISFQPGTHELYFNTTEIIQGGWRFENDDLVQINSDTGETNFLLDPGESGNFLFSPNGLEIVIITPEVINLVNADGTNFRHDLLKYPLVKTYSEFLYYAQPIWAVDSSKLAVALPSDDPLAQNLNGKTYIIPLDGSLAREIGVIQGDFYFTQVFTSSSVSPDFKRVAFTREEGSTNQRNLYLANLDGSDETLITSGDIQWIGWAPDSYHFVFSLSDPMNLQLGNELNPPTDLVTGTDIRWINEREFLYLTGAEGMWTLMRGTIDGNQSPVVEMVGDFISYDFTQ